MVVAALITGLALAAMTPYSEEHFSWVETLNTEGWQVATDGSDGSLVYIKRVIVPGAYRRAWSRTESPAPEAEFHYQSVISLYDVDCAQRRLRTVQWVAYEKNNMQGKVVSSGKGDAEWRFAIPDTVGDGVVDAVCR